MSTPAPGNPISMNDVYNETNLTRNMNNFFAVSLVGGGGGLMYHNLGMGGAGSLSAADAIWLPYNNGTNYPLSNWYNYTQDANMHFTYDAKNNNPDYNVDVSIGFSDGTGAPFMFTSFQLAANGGQSNAELLTNLFANADFPNGLYDVRVDVSCQYVGGAPPGPGLNANTTSAYDTDGVGPGTARNAYNIPFFDEFNPLANVLVADGTITGANLIYNNKRTTLELQFN